MKRFFSFAVTAIVVFSSCSNDDQQFFDLVDGEIVTTIKASAEQVKGTRAVLDNSKASFEVNDGIAILVNDNGTDKRFNFTATEAGNENIEFRSSTPQDAMPVKTSGKYRAFFPSSYLTSEQNYFTFPSTFTYEAGKFNMPMLAKSDDIVNYEFKNVCGVLAVTIPETKTIEGGFNKIVLEATAGGFLAADKVQFINTPGDDNYSINLYVNPSHKLTINLNEYLDRGTFYFPIVPGSGYKFKLTFFKDEVGVKARTAGYEIPDGIQVLRNTIYTVSINL